VHSWAQSRDALRLRLVFHVDAVHLKTFPMYSRAAELVVLGSFPTARGSMQSLESVTFVHASAPKLKIGMT